ncbi:MULTISPECIES: signal peptidase I [Aeromonas]|jgi:conjugal transfer pilin signal peptidase TrbI|uniref:signal peptidase I n=1 Tax=Aeromonas TaxID=642 RepID=UPI0009FF2D70|nr:MULTISPECIES: signal peptidase I [Aeromonas]MDO2438345.1 signal peptidase I [Aeromonas veronii]
MKSRNAGQFLIFIGAASVLFSSVWVTNFGVINRNITQSLPNSYFYISYRTVISERYQYVQFWTRNDKFFGTLKFTKQVMGLPGDKIIVKNHEVWINGLYVGNIKSHTQNGLPLEPIQSGVIPPDYYYVAGKHPDSYDSRYNSLGLIHEDQIIGRAYPIF